MRRRRYVAMVGSASLAGCLGRPGETDEDETEATEQETTDDVTEFQKQWEADLPDETVSGSDYQATSDAETAYLGTKSELTALALADGTEQWTLSLDTALAGITIDDDGLYTLQGTTVQRIDPATGESRWAAAAGNDSVQRTDTNQGMVATTDDHVAAGAAGVIVFEKASGELTATLTDHWGTPVRAWNGQFVVAEDSAVTAYDPDGTARWTVDDVPLEWATPVAGSTFVGVGSERFVGIDLDSGTQAWTTEASGEFLRPRTAGTDDTVFVSPVFSDADTFYALDADTGAVRWEVGDTASSPFPPVVLESAVATTEVFDDFDEGMQARDRKTGEQIASSDELSPLASATGAGRTVVTYDTRAVAYRL